MDMGIVQRPVSNRIALLMLFKSSILKFLTTTRKVFNYFFNLQYSSLHVTGPMDSEGTL